jgi:hypothetical protein
VAAYLERIGVCGGVIIMASAAAAYGGGENIEIMAKAAYEISEMAAAKGGIENISMASALMAKAAKIRKYR